MFATCEKCGKSFPGRGRMCAGCTVEAEISPTPAKVLGSHPAVNGHPIPVASEATPAPRNLFETIIQLGHDEDFVPAESDDFVATDAPSGSRAKVDILADRVRRGMPLWHPGDRADFSGLTGAIRPRA